MTFPGFGYDWNKLFTMPESLYETDGYRERHQDRVQPLQPHDHGDYGNHWVFWFPLGYSGQDLD
jgi:hypothetical protein